MLFLFIFFWPTLVLAENQIFISQVQITGGTGKTTEDFIEIFNPSDNQANLKGLRLVKRTETGTSDTLIKSWTADTFIPARSFYLWANSGFTDISRTPDFTTSGSISGNNGIALRLGDNDTGTIIDSISWGTANNGFSNLSSENPEANMALFRQNLYSAGPTFFISTSSPRNTTIQESLPSTTSTPDTTASSTPDTASTTPENLSVSSYVKIYRFLPNPSGEDSGNEWVELQNLDETAVNLEDWLIDDKDIGSGPGADAFVLSGVISAGEIKRFVIPTGSFALNNTGGDEVSLYFNDKSPAQKAAYTAAAYDDGIFEFRDGQWQAPAQNINQNSSGGSLASNSGSSSAKSDNVLPAIQFKINEIFPNPLGDDAGREWVEIYNPENSTSSLEGYFLANGNSEEWGTSAWLLPKSAKVPPKGFLAVMLPKTAFALKNSGAEKVKIFSPQKQLLDFVIYKDAPENQSWAKNADGAWEWGIPSFGLPNNQEPVLPQIFISEILPRPSGDEPEFVEIKNFSTFTINLEDVVLQIGNKNKTFGARDKISPNGFLAIYEDDLPARLSNNGQTVKLADSFGRPVSETSYGAAQAGMAWASENGKDFAWTENPTPGANNIMVLGEATEAAPEKTSGNKTSSGKTATNFSRSDVNRILNSNAQLQEQVFALQESVDAMAGELALLQTQKTGDNQNQPQSAQEGNNGGVIRILVFLTGVLVLFAIVFFVFKYAKF